MDNLDKICQDIKSLIQSFAYKYKYQFNDNNNRHQIKYDVEKFLYKSGYSSSDISVEVTSNPENTNEVHIILIPKSDKGTMLLECLENGSIN